MADARLDAAMVPGELADEGGFSMEAVTPADPALFPTTRRLIGTTPSSMYNQELHNTSSALEHHVNTMPAHSNRFHHRDRDAKDVTCSNTTLSQESSSNGTGSVDLPADDSYLSMDEADGSYLDEFSRCSPGLCGDPSAEPGGGGYALDGEMAEERMTNASSRVMDALDKILREQVNLELEEFQTSLHNLMTRQVNRELEEFQTSLHELLTRQHANHQQLLTHSQTPANQAPQSSDGAFEAVEHDSSRSLRSAFFHGPEDEQGRQGKELDKCMLQLFTSASVISNTLRNRKFRTY